MKNILLLPICLLIVCCASARGPQFTEFKPPSESSGILYVYRLPQMENSGLFPTIYIDEETTEKNLRNNGYLVFELTPGEHTISTRNEGIMKWPMVNGPVEFSVKAAETIFYRLDTTYSGGSTSWIGVGVSVAMTPGSRDSRLIKVPEEVGKQEIINLKQSR